MTSTEHISETISFMRFPLVIAVLFMHFNLFVNPLSYQNVEYTSVGCTWLSYVICTFSFVLPQIAVPLFFLISGYLFFIRKDDKYMCFTREDYFRKLHKRVKTLLIPYLLWNIFTLLIVLHRYLLPNIFPPREGMSFCVNIQSILSVFWNVTASPIVSTFIETNTYLMLPVNMNHTFYPINTPLWFVRDLMVTCVLSPIIYYGVKKLRYGFPIVMGIGWFFFGQVWKIGYSAPLIQALFFFTIGAYFSLTKTDIVEYCRKIHWKSIYIYIYIVDFSRYLCITLCRCKTNNVISLPCLFLKRDMYIMGDNNDNQPFLLSCGTKRLADSITLYE